MVDVEELLSMGATHAAGRETLWRAAKVHVVHAQVILRLKSRSGRPNEMGLRQAVDATMDAGVE